MGKTNINAHVQSTERSASRTSHSNGQEPRIKQISKGYDSYLDERGRAKAKKLANIPTYRLFDRICVSFGVAIICLCNPF